MVPRGGKTEGEGVKFSCFQKGDTRESQNKGKRGRSPRSAEQKCHTVQLPLARASKGNRNRFKGERATRRKARSSRRNSRGNYIRKSRKGGNHDLQGHPVSSGPGRRVSAYEKGEAPPLRGKSANLPAVRTGCRQLQGDVISLLEERLGNRQTGKGRNEDHERG